MRVLHRVIVAIFVSVVTTFAAFYVIYGVWLRFEWPYKARVERMGVELPALLALRFRIDDFLSFYVLLWVPTLFCVLFVIVLCCLPGQTHEE